MDMTVVCESARHKFCRMVERCAFTVYLLKVMFFTYIIRTIPLGVHSEIHAIKPLFFKIIH